MRELQCDWTRITGPTEEPISLDDAKQHLVVQQSDDDGLIYSYIQAARSAAEHFCNRALLTQTWRIQLAAFADVIWLPMAAPLQNDPTASTDPIVRYYDAAGAVQVLPTTYYEADTYSEPGRILRKPDQAFPTVQSDRLRPVSVTYVCGWTSSGLVPEAITQGMRVFLASIEGDRGQVSAASRAAESFWVSHQIAWRPPQCW